MSEMEVTSNNLLKTAAGVIPHEYGIREDGVRWTAYRPYIAPDGLCISYGNPAEDAANKTVLAAHRENVEALLPRAGGDLGPAVADLRAACGGYAGRPSDRSRTASAPVPTVVGRGLRSCPQRRPAGKKKRPADLPAGLLLNRTASYSHSHRNRDR